MDEEPTDLAWERATIERARAGDKDAFAALYRRFAPGLYTRVLLPKLGNRQAAEDALSETFRTLLEKLGDYQDQGKSLGGWLARVAVNKALDMHRQRARTSRALGSFEELLAPLRSEGDGDAGASVDFEELRARVSDVLGRINPRYRRAIELRFMEGKERQDCADALEVKLGTFDVLLLRALRAFKAEWENASAADETEARP